MKKHSRIFLARLLTIAISLVVLEFVFGLIEAFIVHTVVAPFHWPSTIVIPVLMAAYILLIPLFILLAEDHVLKVMKAAIDRADHRK